MTVSSSTHVIADREPEASAFVGWFGGKKRLKQFVPDLGGYAGAVVADANLDGLAEITRRYREHRFE
jgi:hypothetical protein